MVNTVAAQVTLITAIAIVFLGTLFSLITVLSLLRQYRSLRQQRALRQVETPVLRPPDLLPQPVRIIDPNPTEQITVVLEAAPIDDRTPPAQPEKPSVPLHQQAADQVVISIEPGAGPTRDQRNVQKLIDFLKKDAIKPIPKVS